LNQTLEPGADAQSSSKVETEGADRSALESDGERDDDASSAHEEASESRLPGDPRDLHESQPPTSASF
jgi:hypothetical protein